jgi:hypothetical protein
MTIVRSALQMRHSWRKARFNLSLAGSLATALLSLSLLFAGSASAAYEQVKTFATSGTGHDYVVPAQGAAVNETGAGGVTPGTVYIVNLCGNECNPSTPGVATYSSKGEFLGAWGNFRARGIAVDQATGNVYIEKYATVAGDNVIEVFNPDGSKVLASFGQLGGFNETVLESPEKIHSLYEHSIEVDDSGNVYFADVSAGGGIGGRIMVFRPQNPGDYEHYEYTGRASDIAEGRTGYGGISFDSAGNLYIGQEGAISEFAPGEPDNPKCEFLLSANGIQSAVAGTGVDEVFYYSAKNKKIHQLACNGEGKFVEKSAITLSPPPTGLVSLALNRSLEYEAGRPKGTLYAVNADNNPTAAAIAYIAAPAAVHPPTVLSEAASSVTSTTAVLGAQVNPNAFSTSYVFQLLKEDAYQANEPDERQSLTVSANEGLYGYGFEGRHLGGAGTLTLSSGSAQATELHTATATATLKAAKGTGDLHGALGQGTVIAESTTITAVSASEGTFEVGQGIEGQGIPSGTTITAVSATASKANVSLSSGTKVITAAQASEGTFEVGQVISGSGLQEGSEITAVNGEELTLSKPVRGPSSGVELKAGSTTLTSVTPGIGSFEAGEAIEGEGIAPNTTVVTVGAGTLKLSQPVQKSGTAVPIYYPGPNFFAVGEKIEGAGIPADTTITALKSGALTLSNPATESAKGVSVHAGLSATATAAQVGRALEGLSTVGKGNVRVSGGPGDEAGSSPYEITFVGDLENTNVPQLSVEDLTLSGGAASVVVQTEHEGGGGFASGATEVPVGGTLLGVGNSPLGASAALTALAPDTAYRYRVIASSHCDPDNEAKLCETPGAAQSFHTFAELAPNLPDGRTYELVSPPLKQVAEVAPLAPVRASCGSECKPKGGYGNPVASSPDGEAIAYRAAGPFSSSGTTEANEYLARRTASGWQSVGLSMTRQDANGFQAFDATLTRGVTQQGSSATLNSEAPENYENLYEAVTAAPASPPTPFVTSTPPNRGGGTTFQPRYAGASADLSRVFFSANDALTEETEVAPAAVDGGETKDNLYERSGGVISLVNVLPGNTSTVPGASFGFGPPTISSDGSRAFWNGPEGKAYVRVDGVETVEIPGAGNCHLVRGFPEHSEGACFLTASSDGSKALLLNGELFSLAADGEHYELEADLTDGKGGFIGIAGQSDDLSSIYFVDTAVLSGEEENGEGDVAQPGERNLYAWSGGETKFIGTLTETEFNTAGGSASTETTWEVRPSHRMAEASPNGRYLAFLSDAPLAGNVNPCSVTPERVEIKRCPEVFLFDAQSGSLRCASCNPTAATPLGSSSVPFVSGALNGFAQPTYLTDQGRLYFDSRDSLSPFDTNQGVEDVYELEPEGVGDCSRSDGCLRLISAGREPNDSNFAAIDATGKNVFFTTRDKLALKDHDEFYDLYDAREGGGIAAETETARGECQGEACQPQTSAPNDPTPASSSFEGAGNVHEAKAKKAKKHKHAKKHKKTKTSHKRAAHKRAASHHRGGAK